MISLFPLLNAQAPRGPGGFRKNADFGGTTRAVVVGISDYQHPDIPDLRFADRDAEAFVQFLRSPSGGTVPDPNIRLLTNREATLARFAEELQWLYEDSRPGDRAYIYFSGHGDVETETGNEGFLLCADASPKVYTAGGAYGIHYLKSRIQTLTADGVQVILITDACHAGQLAGSPIGGPQLVAQSMLDQYSHEVKLMGCQPNEKSFEYPAIGGGRGVFSYYLILGLSGLADQDADGLVTLREVERYIKDQVPEETYPNRQNPICKGDAETILSAVDADQLTALREDRNSTFPVLAQFDARAFESELLNETDSTIRHLVAEFKDALTRKRYFMPKDSSADACFIRLTNILAPQSDLYRYLRRYYAVALQEDAQQAILAQLDENLVTGPETRILARQFQDYPRMLARSAEILGPKHPHYADLAARKLWLDGFLMYAKAFHSPDSVTGQRILDTFNLALGPDPRSPIVHYYKSLTFLKILQRPDSAIAEARKAVAPTLNWILPLVHLAAQMIKNPFYDFETAKLLLDEAGSRDSSQAIWHYTSALYHFDLQEYDLAEASFRAVIGRDSSSCLAWTGLGACMASPDRLTEAETVLSSAIHNCPRTSRLRYVYGCVLSSLGRQEEAKEQYQAALNINESLGAARDSLAQICIREGRPDLAEQEFQTMIRLNPRDHEAYFQWAMMCYQLGDLTQTKRHLEDYFQSLEAVHTPAPYEQELEKILAHPELQDLRKQYWNTK